MCVKQDEGVHEMQVSDQMWPGGPVGYHETLGRIVVPSPGETARRYDFSTGTPDRAALMRLAARGNALARRKLADLEAQGSDAP